MALFIVSPLAGAHGSAIGHFHDNTVEHGIDASWRIVRYCQCYLTATVCHQNRVI